MTATEAMVCVRCGAPAQVDHSKSVPGIVGYAEIHHLPCPACGKRGVVRQDDRYQPMKVKKANAPAYERSPYRGGRL